MTRRITISILCGVTLLGVFGAQYFERLTTQTEAIKVGAYYFLSVFTSAEVQWITAACIGLACIWLTVFRRYFQNLEGARRRVNGREWILFFFILIASVAYASGYPFSASRTDFLVLLGGVTLGRGAGLLVSLPGSGELVNRAVSFWTILLLGVAAGFHPDTGKTFHYRDQSRWMGPWDNPNSFGMLMGVGVIFVVGALLRRGRWRAAVPSKAAMALTLVAGAIMTVALVKSYSRGSWIATWCGLGYLLMVFARSRAVPDGEGVTPSMCGLWDATVRHFLRFRGWYMLLLISILSVAVWQYRHTELRPVRRIFSIANVNDFSWRNRVLTGEAELRMMHDRPWNGFGWNRSEQVYMQFYRPARLVESQSVFLNDYLLIGISLGLPALFALLAYIILKFVQAHRQPVHVPVDWQPVVCRASALALMVGFVPEHGLFDVSTGLLFWIRLELGSSACDSSPSGRQ